MRKNLLLIGVGLLVAVLAIGAIACSDDDGDGDGNGNGNGNGEVFRLDVTLTGPDANGTAEITVNGEGIFVSISMTGLQEGVHANHIHEGSCDSQGAIHIGLDNIVADATGDGSQSTGNNEQSLSHYESGHYLAVHEADGDPGAVVSCGDIVVP